MTSCTSPAWAWTPAEAVARRWWEPGRSPDSGGPLLRDAVERPEAPHQVGAVDADDLAAGKDSGERGQGSLVPRRVVGGHQHDAVGDVEVRVAGGEPLAF